MAKVVKIKVIYYAHEDGTKGTLCAIYANAKVDEAIDFIEEQLKGSMILDEHKEANLKEVATNIALKEYDKIGYYEFGIENDDLLIID